MDPHQRAYEVLRPLTTDPGRYGVAVSRVPCGTTIVDCGVAVEGGLEAGRILAEICLGGLGTVSILPANGVGSALAAATVQTVTDQPLAACLGSQYAGWKVSQDGYFAMASGPMRAAGSREPLLTQWNLRVTTDSTVGVLESSKLPPDSVCQSIAASCGIAAELLVLLVARTGSLAGGVQVVARSVEVAMHKLVETGFDVRKIRHGIGTAPLSPVSTDDTLALGRTNDAILYGGSVTLWVEGDCDWSTVVAQLPSDSSPQHGRPFGELFAEANYDFFQLDPHLFSPAEVTLVDMATGKSYRAGALRPDILARSFGEPIVVPSIPVAN